MLFEIKIRLLYLQLRRVLTEYDSIFSARFEIKWQKITLQTDLANEKLALV
jgi:hypothetical protein